MGFTAKLQHWKRGTMSKEGERRSTSGERRSTSAQQSRFSDAQTPPQSGRSSAVPDSNVDLVGGGDSVVRSAKSRVPPPVQAVDDLEGQLTNDKLRELERIFEDADEDGGGGLDMDEFRNAMRKAISQSLTDRELDIMFMKVSADTSWTIDEQNFA